MMRHLLLSAVVAGSSLLCSPAGIAAMPSLCQAPDDVLGVTTPAPHLAAVLKPRSTLAVLAIGSTSLLGPEPDPAPGNVTTQTMPDPASTGLPIQILTGTPSKTAFPRTMAEALEAAVPGLHVTITVRAGRGLTAADQLRVLADTLKPGTLKPGTLKPDTLKPGTFQLVIWQTGTVEAVRNLPPSEFAQTLADGVTLAQQVGADIVLIDPQFSRFLQTNSDIEPYEDAFQQLGSIPGVLLFHRYDLMRHWVDDGRIDLERTPKTDRMRVIQQLHACLGAQLARFILAAARS
jgi:hypothetical protein